MSVWNSYCTLAEFKSFLTPPGQSLNPDTVDDGVIEKMLERASRRLEDLMGGRTFYPRIATYRFDIPRDGVIWFGDDLLEVTTFTNGDDTVIASTEYILKPANAYPKYCLEMRDISTVTFQYDSNSSAQQVIDVLGYWGYHEQFGTRAWKSAGTLGAAMATTTGLTFTMTAGHTLDVGGGQIVKIDNELLNTVSSAATSLVVVGRGDNGSTAATHLNGATVYLWQHMEDITGLALEIANMMYKSRYQPQAVESNTYMSGGGMVVTPRSLPAWAQELIRKYQRIV